MLTSSANVYFCHLKSLGNQMSISELKGCALANLSTLHQS